MKKILFLIVFLLSSIIFSQVNFEPVTNSVYKFLERQSNKGIININAEILPFSRKQIVEKLKSVSLKVGFLSNLEKDELNFYLREFADEYNRFNGSDTTFIENRYINIWDKVGFDKNNRFRFFSFDSKEFGLYIDPIAEYGYEYNKGKVSKFQTGGLRFYGHISDFVGIDIQFMDMQVKGDYYDTTRSFTPKTGYGFIKNKWTHHEFDFVRANLNLSWKWGSFTLGKDFNYYGSGENGKIILSNKAPSFPYIKLEVNPIEWFRFSYIHGSLDSQIMDSSSYRVTPGRDHFSNVEKYYVAHLFSFNILQNLNFSFGESVIYSDKFEPIYLIPIIPFRYADHYMTSPDERAGNAQIFFSSWYRNHYLRTKFYGSFFIDELSISKPENPQALAYNIGMQLTDPLIPESDFIIEYSKLQPFVYFHTDHAQTYEHYGYQLGHWIGSNGDQLYLKIRKKIIRGFNADLYYSYIRKGNSDESAEERYQDDAIFLWGLKKYYTDFGIDLSYEIFHTFYLNAKYRNSKIESEQESGEFKSETNSYFTFSFSYGL